MDQIYKFIPGQKLFIDLHGDECFIGEFKAVYPKSLDVINTYNVKYNTYLSGTTYFYKNEIKSVRPYQLGIKQQVIFNINNNNDYKFEQDSPEITAEELFMIEKRINNHIYLRDNALDPQLNAILDDISEQDSIVLSVETTTNFGRNSKPEVISILTKRNIYIFDITLLRIGFKRFVPILEGKKPIKIMHDSRAQADCLKYNLDIHIRSVFDTLVAFLGTDGGVDNIQDTSLETYVHKYLNVDSKIFTTGGRIDWYPRPLDEYRKRITAKKLLFIQKLYEVSIQKHLLRNFYKTCDMFAYAD